MKQLVYSKPSISTITTNQEIELFWALVVLGQCTLLILYLIQIKSLLSRRMILKSKRPIFSMNTNDGKW